MKKTFVLIFLFIKNILFCTEILSTESYLFKQLSISEGFPASINTIYAEEKGFVWIGNKDGLGRYDGYSLKTYKHNPQDINSLPGNEIYQIIEDNMNNIIVLTNYGIARYDRQTDSFKTITDIDNNNIKATASCNTKNGIIFISENYLYKYDSLNHMIKSRTKIEKKHFLFHEIIPWDENTLLCLNKWNGIFLLDINSGIFRSSPLKEYDREVSRVLIDSKNRIWTTSYNKGITCHNKKGEIIHTYSIDNSSISHNVILCIMERNGEIWVGTDGGGINIINPETNQIKTLIHIPGDKNSLPINTIQYLYNNEKSDICWAGSVKGGVINIHKSFIQTYTDVPLNTNNGLSEKAILSFFQEPNSEYIWIGTDGGGINLFNPLTLEFKHYPSALDGREKIVAICNYNKNELLISLFSKGIFIFNKQTGKIKPINENIPEISKLALYSRKSINLYQDDKNSILILGPIIYRYHPQTGIINKITIPENMNVEPHTIVIDSDKTYTYLYDYNKIYTINKETNKINILYTINEENEIKSVSRDKSGRLWLGTNKGISYFNPENKIETTLYNLPIYNIQSITCDNNNTVWIATSNYLYSWIIDKHKLLLWDKSDGVLPNEYLNKAILKSKQGDIYMGGINGMMRIVQKEYKPYIPEELSLSLTDITCNNKSLLPYINTKNKELLLNTDNKNIVIKIMTHEHNILREKQFRWYISGTNEQCIDTEMPEISIRELLPGKYNVSVSCSTQDALWSPKTEIITIIVPPAWFQSWWFITICIIVTAILLIFIIVNILKRKEEKIELAINEHKQKIYEEKVRFLININHELRTPLTLIHTPINHLLKKVEPNSDVYSILSKMLKQTQRMKEMLNMVLNLRKMEMTTDQLYIGTYQLNEWIKEIGQDFCYEEKEKNINIKYEFDNNIKQIEFDKEKHTIILTNLIINAIKHSPKNSTITIKTELTDDKKMVRISVSDQGCGLQGVDMNSLFTRFYQGKNEKEGSGIGLSYAKILVEQHNGKITACNNNEGGAYFYYELPVVQDSNKEKVQIKDYLNKNILSSEIIENETTNHPTINDLDTSQYSCLFVDDNQDIRNLVIETLKDSFKNIYLASNGKEALDIALAEIPDIIISDIMMPQMDGYELCRSIKENMNINHIQVILLTARIDEESRLNGYRVGADAYIEKPFNIDILLETVKNRLYLRNIIRKRYMISPINNDIDTSIKSTDDTFLFKLNKLIIENMSDDKLNILFLCKEIGMSRASLYNKLKPLTDMSPNEYINKIRMEKAIEMLKQDNMSITEISEKTGFSSSRYFSTAFKQYTGMTPTQFKKKSTI